ncbi:MAG: fatty acid oxidation complex subunit alpha FadJ, partial [Gammaproteobacteria bacterium]|nr:fatty acid oxidation complex subunit alpha FadJ [Gammaproteobacteria bacterium]
MVNSKSFNAEILEDNIAVVCMDIPGEKQNTLRGEFTEEINKILDELDSKSLSGIILTSGKKNSFVVGADINMLSSMQTKEQILEVTSAGYAVFNRIEQLTTPIVAEIHGTCMGGGLELALACHGRVCSNHPSSILALPEVQLGLLPGGGGTQRLPALIGVTEALGMMTTGRNVRSSKALKMGLVDDVTDPVNLRGASLRLLKALSKNSDSEQSFEMSSLLSIKAWQTLLFEKNQAGLNFLFQQARKKAFAKTRGNYPAVEKIIDCVEDWSTGKKELGYKTEAQSFAELVLSPEAKNLIGLFFAITELKKDKFVNTGVAVKEIKKLGIVGGGLMGAGIAFVSANKTKATIRIRDVSESGVNHALKYAWSKLQSLVKKRHIQHPEALVKMSQISAGTDYAGFAHADLVIEAVFESLELKHQILKDVESHCAKDTIFATNTSSIPISDIAAVAKRPENVIGMHYFSPVEKMPLLELVVTEKTSDQVIATTVAFGKQQGKTVIVVNDGAGFYTSRV